MYNRGYAIQYFLDEVEMPTTLDHDLTMGRENFTQNIYSRGYAIQYILDELEMPTARDHGLTMGSENFTQQEQRLHSDTTTDLL